jgi:Fe-S cluster assembly protein SufD
LAEAVTEAGLLAELDQEAVDVRSAGEPKWLRQRRAHALSVFDATPFPTTKLEEWRYTDVSLFEMDRVSLLGRGQAQAQAQGNVNGGNRAAGVVVMDLARAAVELPELLQKHLAVDAVPPELGKFAALNGALWDAGVLVYVPANVHVEEPIRITRRIDESGVAVFPRTLIVAERMSHVAVVEELTSPDFDEPVFSCAVTEVIAGAGADVQYVVVQNWGRGVRHVATQRTIASRDANLDTLVVNLGASVSRVDNMARLEGPGSRSDMLGVYFGREDQHFDHNTRQDHVSPHASSDLLYKGALLDRSNAVFRGIIRVHPKAQRTDAYQTNRNLLLSPDAKATSLPNLEIEADDVRCSHGATVGQLDREEMFYLMSRGLSRREAERLVVFGFLAEALERLPLPGIVAELRRAIEARIV